MALLLTVIYEKKKETFLKSVVIASLCLLVVKIFVSEFFKRHGRLLNIITDRKDYTVTELCFSKDLLVSSQSDV